MIEEKRLTLPALFEETARKYKDYNALSFSDEIPLTYGEVEVKIQKLIAIFEKLEIQKGDKVALLSTNMPNWPITYFAITFIGAIAIPLLPDYTNEEIKNILNHSEAKAIFISYNLLSKIENIKNNYLQHKFNIEELSLINKKETIKSIEPSIKKYDVRETDLAAIIYTSGTTGEPKGVMLSHKNICINAIQSKKVQHITENDRFLSILPLSHVYENTIGSILPMMCGACVYYLKKPPTPVVLLPALLKVKPTIMLSVPLIIEKIYRQKILPTFNKSFLIKKLYQIPAIRKKLNLLAGKKLYKTFGSELKFFGIGGSKLDKTVEEFLREAKFPYAIGYGLTETAPLLAGVNPLNTVLQSTGPVVEGVEIKINEPDKITGEGEIWAKGPNVMKGYYKNEALTKEVLTDDGWFKTGDLGVFDENNNLYLKGRLKNVIVNANGENIYPEDIESIINNFNFVNESLVVQQKGKLVAMVHFNREELEKTFAYIKEEVAEFVENKINELVLELHNYINEKVSKNSRIQLVIAQHEPFVKTATLKIKRFLYY